MKNLSELDIRDNEVHDYMQINYLSRLPNLRKLKIQYRGAN